MARIRRPRIYDDEYGIYINGSLIEKNDLGALSDDETKRFVAAEVFRHSHFTILMRSTKIYL